MTRIEIPRQSKTIKSICEFIDFLKRMKIEFIKFCKDYKCVRKLDETIKKEISPFLHLLLEDFLFSFSLLVLFFFSTIELTQIFCLVNDLLLFCVTWQKLLAVFIILIINDVFFKKIYILLYLYI